MSGLLIVIEGGDASGKATQTKLLQKRLEADGVAVKTLSFPRYSNTVGGLIRECLDGKRGDFMSLDSRVASTLYATDRFETKVIIEEWLQAGAVVILDRYTSANLLHQGAKLVDDQERKDTIEWIYKLEHNIFGLPVPDCLIYLEVPASVRMQLQQQEGRIKDLAEVDLTHQEAVDKYAPGIMNVYANSHQIACVNNGQLRTIEDIQAELYNIVKVKLPSN